MSPETSAAEIDHPRTTTCFAPIEGSEKSYEGSDSDNRRILRFALPKQDKSRNSVWL